MIEMVMTKEKDGYLYMWSTKDGKEWQMIRVPLTDVENGKVKKTAKIESGGSWIGKLPSSVDELISKFF